MLKTLQREVGNSIEAVLPTLEKIAAEEAHLHPLRQVCGALAGQARRVASWAKAVALVRLLKTIPDKVVVFTCFRATSFPGWHPAERRFTGSPVAWRDAAGGEGGAGAGFCRGRQGLGLHRNGERGTQFAVLQRIVNYDLPWNPMRIEQRIGRLHRIDQARNVSIYNLSAAGTVEAHILELLDAKINMFQLVVGELDMILGNLREKRDFEDIIMDIWAGARTISAYSPKCRPGRQADQGQGTVPGGEGARREIAGSTAARVGRQRVITEGATGHAKRSDN